MSPNNAEIHCDKAAIGSYEGKNGSFVIGQSLVMNGNPEKGLLAVISNGSQVVYDKPSDEKDKCKIVDVGNQGQKSLLFTCDSNKTTSSNVLNITCPDIVLFMTPVSLAFPEYAIGLIGVICGIVVIFVLLLLS
eukprot:gnl/Chilomastix_caulleri/3052.p1 GENE.gnl/Chilomastix_caulleri/3052~~gnl/Chilomastix_caulleri/3052.p1  ORF type:complete len:134 (+),score=30.88 gnl/Chilomastix_caulleri/3052:245-646(+)